MIENNDFRYVKAKIKSEGFHYTFKHYSDFEDVIKDKKFHKLRKEYLAITKELEEYIDKKIEEENF